MAASTMKLTILEMKLLKIAKGLNKFTVYNITPILEESDEKIQKAISHLLELNYIKQISDTEYLYTHTKKIIHKPQPKAASSITYGNNEDDNNPDDPWLTIDEVALLLNIKPNTVLRKCLKCNYIVKLNTNKELSGKYLIKKSSINLYPELNDDERKFLDKETKKLFHNKDEERLYITSSDRGKKFIYKFLKLFKMTENLSSVQIREFLKVIGMQNPKLKVSYSLFYTKRKRYYEEGLRAIFPKSFMSDYLKQEVTTKTNLNRLPKTYGFLSTEQIEILYKCFLFNIPNSQTSKIANTSITTVENITKYVRAKIYDKQYNELLEFYRNDPQKPLVRAFWEEVSIDFYCYKNTVYVTRKPINDFNKYARPLNDDEIREIRRLYSFLYRKQFARTTQRYFEHHVATALWKEYNCNYEDQLNKLYALIHG